MASKFNTVIHGSAHTIVGDNATINITRPAKGSKKEAKPQVEIKVPSHPSQETSENKSCKVVDESFNNFDYTITNGYALIVNNKHYPHRSTEPIREGSDEDVKAVTKFLDSAGFRIRKEENLDQAELMKILGDISERDFQRNGAFVCVFLSHGGENGITCTDEKHIPVEIIVSKFNSNNCPSLQGKPKLFFVQACRGGILDSVSIQSDASMESPPVSKMPSDPDILIAYGTCPGRKSLRHAEIGTWFIQKLIGVFNEFAHEEHLMDMILRLNCLLANMKTEGGAKQTPCQSSTLSKKVYFKVPPPAL